MPYVHRARRARRAALLCLCLPAAALSQGCGDGPGAGPTPATGAGPTSAPAGTATLPTSGPGAAPAGAVEITYAAGAVTGPARLAVDRGGTVELLVTSDVADEVHVHAYDIVVPVAAGVPTPVSFTATIPGVFEVEMEDAGRRILTLEVRA